MINRKKVVKPKINIGHRVVGEDFPPVVIAEIGINHEGELEVACEMVDAAIAAGAEIIKHQTHVVEDEMSPAAREVIPGNADVSIYEIMERCALSEKEEIELKSYVEKQGAIFISTPFSRAAAERLERMGVCAYKIGSGECNNYPLIEHVAAFGKPMIISTGMNTIESVERTVDIVRRHGVPYALLHCTNVYPTPSHLVRLGGMQQLQQSFPDAVVGLSDHTTSNLACLAATAMGASILERHFTDRIDRPGPDIVNSMDPVELKALIEGSQEIAKMRGGRKEAASEEQSTIDFAFATVVSIKDIQEGELLSLENIWVKRPGTGPISADLFDKVEGCRAARNIPVDQHLQFEDIEGFDKG
ncbi:N-acetylneuraminate synthase family protein [Desulfogranum marinum]|uniref:N-acetylneuraminate synthase family protein n=1 Tax=Desulfogranum marinum TaxID=453220 RepID=UPI00196491EB|nr:N-acetylneuraminate synthase family protein [Desulfogranum marinum]MBM9513004.1 N-acetylneuraminate synthase family protein [Desulfogranum marinum]